MKRLGRIRMGGGADGSCSRRVRFVARLFAADEIAARFAFADDFELIFAHQDFGGTRARIVV